MIRVRLENYLVSILLLSSFPNITINIGTKKLTCQNIFKKISVKLVYSKNHIQILSKFRYFSKLFSIIFKFFA